MEAHAVRAPRASVRRVPVRHSVLTDERLARLVAQGDERAFQTLYERYYQPLYRYCRSMLRHEADAQDALQSAMTGAYTALRRAQRDAPVRPWLFRIAHNESISVLRRRRPDAELTDDLGGAGASVEDHEERRAELALLIADLKELPERQRGALVMRELSGLSHEDIALALDTSLGGAKQAIFEARRALGEFAEGRAMGCEEVCRLISDADGRVLRGRRVRAHLRECPSCSSFAAMIPSRSADLRALAPPLPAIAAAGLLARIAGGSSAGGAGAGLGGGGAGIAGGLTGKGVAVGLLAKAAAGVVIVSGATFGITSAVEQPAAVHHHATPSAPLTRPAGGGAPATGTTAAQKSQVPGTPSASHRSNAAPQASFGQQTSEAARSAIHGKSAVEQPAAVHHHATPSAPLTHPAAGGTAAAGTTGAAKSQVPGTPSASHRSNAAPQASFGQQTSEAARSAVHGKSALAPPGLTVTRPIVTRPPHPATPSVNAGSRGTSSSIGSTVSSTRSQLGRTESSQHTSTTQMQATLHQSAQATTRTTHPGLLNHVAHLIG